MNHNVAKIPSYAWVVLIAVYIATLAAPLNQFKVPPMMTTLQDHFRMSDSSAGSLMSAFSIMGFILAIPSGFIVRRFGIRRTTLCAIGTIAVGCVLGAISETKGLLAFGRFIEGAGMGLIMVAAPAAIALWFPAEKRAFPMGLWAGSVPIGNMGMLNLAPILAEAYGWRSVWWAGAAFAAFGFLIFAILFRLPNQEEVFDAPQARAKNEVEKADYGIGKAMANRDLWLLTVEFMCFNLAVMALSSFYPKFLETTLEYSKSKAAFVTSLMMLAAIFSGPAGSYLSDRIGSRKALIVAPFMIATLFYLFPFSITGWMIPAFMTLAGIIMGSIPPVTLAAAPETMPSPALAGIGLGIVALGQNLGMYIGPILFGALLETTNWAVAGYAMMPICAIGVLAAWLARIR